MSIILTGDLSAFKIDCTSTVRISERKKCFREGYKMHQTSVVGSAFAADAMNKAAPSHNISRKYQKSLRGLTLPYPAIRMIH